MRKREEMGELGFLVSLIVSLFQLALLGKVLSSSLSLSLETLLEFRE